MTIVLLLLAIPIGYVLIKGWIWLVNAVMNPLIAKVEAWEQNQGSQLEFEQGSYSKPRNEKERKKEETILHQLGISRPEPMTDEYVIFMRNRGVRIE